MSRPADPLWIDRYLDGECTADEVAAFEAEMRADADLGRAVAMRRRFLAALAAQGAAWRAGLGTEVPPGLEARVREGARATRNARRPGWARWAAAAVLLVGVGLAVLIADSNVATAVPQEALDAAALARLDIDADRETSCSVDGATSPFAFPLVKDGELFVASCETAPGGATSARLYRPEELPVVGFVAVPEPGTRPSQTVGKTDLGDVIVYDVMFGQSRAYLAVLRTFVEARGECAACHNRSRDGQKNPHVIELRRGH